VEGQGFKVKGSKPVSDWLRSGRVLRGFGRQFVRFRRGDLLWIDEEI
jgi:hypothetical protein